MKTRENTGRLPKKPHLAGTLLLGLACTNATAIDYTWTNGNNGGQSLEWEANNKGTNWGPEIMTSPYSPGSGDRAIFPSLDTTPDNTNGQTVAMPTSVAIAGLDLLNSAYSFTLGGTKTPTTFSPTAITKSGAGTVTIGATISGNPSLTVASGSGTLTFGQSGGVSLGNVSGFGTVASSTVTITGTHTPGGASAVGAQNISGNLTYATGSTFAWDLNGNSTTGGFDTVPVTGTVAVNNANFSVVLGSAVNLANSFWTSGSQNWSLSSIFGKAITGTGFNSSVAVSGQSIAGKGSFSINGTNLTWTAVPEPTGLLAGLLLGGGLLRRRRGRDKHPKFMTRASFHG